ncbi:MAG: bis(5'-nucleosyl)-tetraphosphatase (symmetrical) YqeK [Oscillospiraceae bacterium]|jgi:nicotinate-nucleotide adenylyltransferase|nr:bis(5'-nucleosyl)-tetraphosphatase (symmetrical) YqeK [Oscillospiraceae bacterium]
MECGNILPGTAYTPPELRALALRRLSAPRYLHTLGVGAEARALALRYGASVQDAACAALLHDMTKEDDQLKLCAGYGIMPSGFELAAPKMLHALTAAAFARRLGAPEDAVNAVRYHTTARAGMSDLEKIVYLADFTEPFRRTLKGTRSGLARLRALVFIGLDTAMDCALALSADYLAEEGKPLHQDTLEAMEEMKGKATRWA